MIAARVVAIAFFLTVLLVPLVRRAALRVGLVAKPGERHAHTKTTPVGGGIAMFLAVWTAVALSDHPPDPRLFGVFLGSLVLFLVCVVDDFFSLPAGPRFLVQILVAVIAWHYGVQIEFITALFVSHVDLPMLPVGWLSAPFTVLWIVFMTNAVNWIDGLDGLAAGVIAIASATLATMGFVSGNVLVGVASAALAASCVAFLIYNFNPARIFMGDAGAMFLGYMVACLSVLGAFKSTALVAVAVPILALGIPIYDTLSTMLGRLWRGQPIHHADRTHFHHRLLDRGLSVRQTVLTIYGLTAMLCLIALGLWWR